ncbi:hypothetical protein [Bacillus infantis]|uniref:hypothetical protein n=1 Tax=Bacillus infantis TaxID=324767 RepID=UPI0021554891|nr:hypothetical protein [Bacillus infantis]MCR6613409.1 hypothetical protein [Bacillus infantis]
MIIKKQISLKAERVAFYLQGQVIEAFSEKNEAYYLIFYKYHFLTALKTAKLRRRSYIEHAFKKGMVFESPHPLIGTLLSANHPCQCISFNQLLKKLERQYTPLEKASILTFFESLIPKRDLFNEIKSVYFEYRRNGDYFSGYQIIRLLMDFAPKTSLAVSHSNDMIFSKYAWQYSEKPEELFAKDPIFAEKTLYSQREDEECLRQLIGTLEKESRWMDLIALSIHKLIASPSPDCYAHLLKLLAQHTEIDSLQIQESLSFQLPAFLPLQKDVFENYIQNHAVDKVFKLMQSHAFQLEDSQIYAIGEMLEEWEPVNQPLQPDLLYPLIRQYINRFPEKADKLLKKFVISLLNTHELPYIQNWLKPLKDSHEKLAIIEKIDMMQKLYEDPDDMQLLGELYFELSQLDKAVECFSWEMELRPADPRPLQWLAKTYHEKGMDYESDAYRQLCIQLQKRA